MSYQALLCDMDGTLLDTEPVYFQHFQDQLSKYNRKITKEMFLSQVGLGSQEGAEIMCREYYTDLSPEEYIQMIDLPLFHKRLEQEDLRAEALPYLEDFLQAFQGTLPYTIATGSPISVVKVMRKQFNFDKYFKQYISREEVEHGKPHPQIYLESASRLGVDISKCIVLEDSLMGVRAGVASGAYTIAIINAWTAHFDLSEAQFICSNLKEATEHIQTLLI